MARSIGTIAVFSGSNVGRGEAYIQAAGALGGELARRGIKIVYGGTNKGLMGFLADGALKAGGQVHGVITERLQGKGHLHPALTSHEVLPSMRERKQRMADLADAFIALPGGIGTLEEFMEVWTLNQLGEFQKPAGLLDVQGFFQPFMRFVDHMIAERFLPPEHRQGIVVEQNVSALVDRLASFEPPTVQKWMT